MVYKKQCSILIQQIPKIKVSLIKLKGAKKEQNLKKDGQKHIKLKNSFKILTKQSKLVVPIKIYLDHQVIIINFKKITVFTLLKLNRKRKELS